MASRRILANRRLAPSQEISINPFTSFNSDNINKLSRIVSCGKDVVVNGLEVSYVNPVEAYCSSENLASNMDTKEKFVANWTGENYFVEYSPAEYSSTKSYSVNSYCTYNYSTYKCIVAITYDGTNPHPWNSSEWQLVSGDVNICSESYEGAVRYVDLALPVNCNYGYSYIQTLIDTTKLTSFLGSGVTRDFEIDFNLEIGTPKAIMVSINDSKAIVEHPFAVDEEDDIGRYKIKLSKFFDHEPVDNDGKPYLKFRIGAILDAADPQSKFGENVDGNNKVTKTYVRLSGLVCRMIGYQYPIYSRFEESYNFDGTQPTTKVQISTGVAIKDDVMIQELQKDILTEDICSILDITNQYTWIKNDAYIATDFFDPQSQAQRSQKVYQLNNSKKRTPESSIEQFTSFSNDGRLVASLIGIDYNPTEVTQFDATLSYSTNAIVYKYDSNNLMKFYKCKADIAAHAWVDNEWDKISFETYTLGDNRLCYDVNSNLLDFKFPFTSYSYDTSGNLTLTHTYDASQASTIHTIPADKHAMYGDTVLLTFKESSDSTDPGYVFYKVTNVPKTNGCIGTFSVTIPAGKVPGYMSDPLSIIDCYLCCGPLKVSGDPTYYDPDVCKWAYVVLYYNYFKNPKPNISYIGFIREETLVDTRYRDDYLVLAKVRLIDTKTIDLVSYVDRQSNQINDCKNILYNPESIDTSIWDGQVPVTVEEAITRIAQKIHTAS